jgi:fucose 4-O-acetylase-like acetyltransferase
MNNVISMVQDFVVGITKIFVALIPLGVVAGLVFGDTVIISDVVSNLVALVSSLGESGLVGLLVAIILISLLSDSK